MRLTPLLLLSLTGFAACSEGPSEPEPPGPPTSIVATATTPPSAQAGTAVAPISLKVQDANARGVPGQSVTFAVVAGGGTLAATSATSDAQGIVAIPAWTLGRSALPQTVRATLGAITTDITAQVSSLYNIEVRFYGAPMSAENQALFTNAAARLSGIITGDLINVAVDTERDLASTCGLPGLPMLPAGQIDDVIIYAAVQPIDGPGKILAQAGPCLVRSQQPPVPANERQLTVVGIMSFDAEDVANLVTGGRLQDVITHEMLHVIGIGTLWKARGFLVDEGLNTVNYNGLQARAGCIQVGGSAPCASNVPVENTGATGTRDGHWRESVFDTELMTGFAESSGAMPLSQMTIGALADLGYIVNQSAADPYVVPAQQALMALRLGEESLPTWESVIQPAATITPAGRVESVPAARRR